MQKLIAFNFVTMNGFFKGLNGDVSWAHGDEENDSFAVEQSSSNATLVFGRITYDMMASFWPTPFAAQMNAPMAENMNRSKKIVFSYSMDTADWVNTKVIKGDLVEEMKKLKQLDGPGMCILGSGTIINQLAEAGLIDEYQIMIHPVAIEGGTPFFNGITQKLNLRLTSSRIFKSGKVLLVYQPVA